MFNLQRIRNRKRQEDDFHIGPMRRLERPNRLNNVLLEDESEQLNRYDMTKPYRTNEELFAFWVYYRKYNPWLFNDYNPKLINGWYWNQIMRIMIKRGVLSYDDLDNFYRNSPLHTNNVSEITSFLSESQEKHEPTWEYSPVTKSTKSNWRISVRF